MAHTTIGGRSALRGSIAELSVGPISSTQTNATHQTTDRTQPNPSQSENFWLTNQHNPQPNRTPYNQQQTFGQKEDNLGTLFRRNIMTVRTGDAPNCKFTKSSLVQMTNIIYNEF